MRQQTNWQKKKAQNFQHITTGIPDHSEKKKTIFTQQNVQDSDCLWKKNRNVSRKASVANIPFQRLYMKRNTYCLVAYLKKKCMNPKNVHCATKYNECGSSISL